MKWSKLGKNLSPIGLLESALRDGADRLSSDVELDAKRSDAQHKDGEEIFGTAFK